MKNKKTKNPNLTIFIIYDITFTLSISPDFFRQSWLGTVSEVSTFTQLKISLIWALPTKR